MSEESPATSVVESPAPGTSRAGRLRERIALLPARDQRELSARLRAANRDRDRGRRTRTLAELEAAADVAEGRLSDRSAHRPPITYPPELPVSARVDDLKAAIESHQVIVVAGETGSGKSTQLPKICLDLGRGVRGLIGHTQPRRIAARALAERIAEETGTELGAAIGYTIRFGDHTGPSTMVKLMTDGILLAEIARDRTLSRYDTIIIDEAHERSLNIDFLLGYLARLLPTRPDLKVIITSATIDPQRFSAHFGGAPIVEVSGRTYPVEVRYRPTGVEADEEPTAGNNRTVGDVDQARAICRAVDELSLEGDGDILVFLSGEREIRDTADVLRSHLRSHGHRGAMTEVLPLFGRLSSAEQHKVFERHSQRRVVLATNVAETSLTVPGVRYVIDPGTARISRYSMRTKVQRLPIEPISQASAGQRAGRCGRVADGICIRLYSEDDFEGRPAFTDPEIVRTSLASVILQMAALDLGAIGTFPFLDPPDRRQIGDGLTLLAELGALQPESVADTIRLTDVGRTMAALPIDPQLARMIVAGNAAGCIEEMLVVTAALAIQDVREFPIEDRESATASHARFTDRTSDFLGILNLWRYLQDQGKELSGNAFRRMCRTEYLHYLRVREWQDLVEQLRSIAKSVGVQSRRGSLAAGPVTAVDSAVFHRSLLAGLLSHIGAWDEARREYEGTRGAKFWIWPGSALAKRQPKLVMAAELVETSRLWARMVAAIEPAWVEDVGAHLLKHSYSEPRWEFNRGSAAATEKVTLLGVTIIASRTVNYGSIDPELSRELFIRHALVEGDWKNNQHRFWKHNQELLERIAEREDRARRRDIAIDDETLFTLYDARVPADALSTRHFDAWYRRAAKADRARLEFTEEDLVAAGATDVDADSFPDRMSSAGVDLDLRYVFDPTRSDDGVTVTIPLTVLQRVAPDTFAAQVPGLRSELAIALIRSLPKSLRRAFVPVPDFAAAALQRIGSGAGSLPDQLAAALTQLTGIVVGAADFDLVKVPAHLRMSFNVVDGTGRTVASGKDLAGLQSDLRSDTREAVAAVSGGLERSGLREFPAEPIPRHVDSTVNGFSVRGYPALIDEGATVGVRVFAAEADQLRAARAGTRRLLLMTLRSPETYVRHELPRASLLVLAVSGGRGSHLDFVADATAAAVDALLDWAGGPAWTGAEFAATRAKLAPHLDRSTVDVLRVSVDVLRAAHDVDKRLAGLGGGVLAGAVIDAKTQLAELVSPGFASRSTAAYLPDLLRWVQALALRLDRLPADPERDRARMAEILPYEQRFRDTVAALREDRRHDPDVREVARLLAEWRISLFAQPMRTTVPVSAQRVERALAALAAG